MNTITILGSGDTLGTPLVGCTNPSCLDTDSRSKRYRFGLLLQIMGKNILIDTNPDLKWQCLDFGFQLKDLDAILITHTHSDHVNGMGEFFYRNTEPIPTYHLNHPLIKKHIEYFNYLEQEKVLQFFQYKNYEEFFIGKDICIKPIELNHGFPCSGFVISFSGQKIGVVSDTNLKIPLKSIEGLTDCDYLFVDAFSENMEQVKQVYLDCGIEVPDLSNEWFHMTIEDVQNLQQLIHAKCIYTVHMSRHIAAHQELVDKYQTDTFFIGYDGLKVELLP